MTSWNNFVIFPENRKIILHFCTTLALIAIPRPTASGLQTGRHGGANRRVKFFHKGKKRKFQLVKPGAQLSKLIDNKLLLRSAPWKCFLLQFTNYRITNLLSLYFDIVTRPYIKYSFKFCSIQSSLDVSFFEPTKNV